MCDCIGGDVEPGLLEADPIVVGVPNGVPPVRVIGLRGVGRFARKVKVWITGAGVGLWMNDWYEETT